MIENAESKIVQGFLRHIAEDSGDEVLREFACEALRGNIDLADGMAAPAYAEALAPRLDGFTQWYDRLSDDEREAQASACAADLAKLEEQLSDGADRD